MNSAKNTATVSGKSIIMNLFTWTQGEYNSLQQANQGWTNSQNATNDRNQYKAYLKQLITDLFADAKSVFGQDENPGFFMTQHGTNYLRKFEMFIQMALLETGIEDDRTTMVCSLYPVTNRGGHLDPNGQRWVGEYMAKVYNQVILKGEKWMPFQPKKITKTADALIIDFHVPQPPIIFNTWTVQSKANYGFSVRNNGTAFTISRVTITGPTQITVKCSTPFSGDVEIAYATYGVLYGNVCDSDTYRSLTNYKQLPVQLRPAWEPKDESGVIIYDKPYPLNNFCLQFYYKLPVGKNIINIF